VPITAFQCKKRKVLPKPHDRADLRFCSRQPDTRGPIYTKISYDLSQSYPTFIVKSTHDVLYTLCLRKRFPDIFSYNSSKNCPIFIYNFWHIYQEEIRQSKIVYLPTSPQQCLCTTLWNRKTQKSRLFTLMLLPTSRDFNQSLLGFFNLIDCNLDPC